MSAAIKNCTDYNHEAGMTFQQREELYEKERRDWVALKLIYKRMRKNKWRFDRGMDLDDGDQLETFEAEYESIIEKFRAQTVILERLQKELDKSMEESFNYCKVDEIIAKAPQWFEVQKKNEMTGWAKHFLLSLDEFQS